MQLTPELAAAAPKFWAKVKTSGECWTRSNPGCYGRFQGMGAHRYAYLLTFGEIPAGAFICHECDNPPCVNPDHLWPGTSADNNSDKISKERHPHGKGHVNTTLTEDDVRRMRQLFKDGMTCKEISRLYPISYETTWDLLRGRSWRHVEGATPRDRRTTRGHPYRKG